MKQTITLLGAKRSVGKLDNGSAYDSTKLYAQVPMNTSADTVGFAIAEYNWGDSTNFAKIQNLTFPLQAELDFELVTNGKNSKLIVVDVKPLDKKI